jgi:hypothetical protein
MGRVKGIKPSAQNPQAVVTIFRIAPKLNLPVEPIRAQIPAVVQRDLCLFSAGQVGRREAP